MTAMKVAVLGAGNWGTTLAHLAGDNGHQVLLWTRQEAQAKEINERHTNEHSVPELKISPNVRATTSLKETLADAPLVLMVIPSQAFRSVSRAAGDLLLPEQIVIPIASGSQLTKIDKGFRELIAAGLVEDRPYKVFGAQAEGCSPVSAAFKAGHDVVRPVKPDTIAKSLAIGNPADGPYVLDAVRRTGGAVEDVTDAEVVEGIRLLARTEGIFAETAGGVTVGVLKKLVESGGLDPALETVVINSGEGLKTLDAVAPVAKPSANIAPNIEAFRATGLV